MERCKHVLVRAAVGFLSRLWRDRNADLRRLSLAMFLLVAGTLTHASDTYWQQEVNYAMDVTLRSDRRTIDGSIAIEYINNSPDSLRVLYLKAFPNAVQKGSYSDKHMHAIVDYDYHDLTPKTSGSLTLKERKDGRSNYESFTVDNTIITVHLSQPLTSGDTVHLSFDFETVLPDPGKNRMGVAGKVGAAATKGVYWYPQVCVYDHKLGWVNSQYIDWGECYGDYGTFDVRITAPENEIVAATGVLVNQSEVMPDSLRTLVDISRYLGEKSTWPSLSFDTSRTKTWHFMAESVNDFTFVASPDFCLDSARVNGVEVAIYAQKSKAKGWKDAVRLSCEALETFSDLVHPYAWPVLRVTDSYDGMEYPMLASCGGNGPSPRFSYLLYHEIGHQWFMGMIGTNSPDRPFLDEGFCTHIEHVAMEKYYGRERNFDNFTTWYQKKFAPHVEDRDERGFRPLMLTIINDLDKPLIFSYDQGEEYLPYRYSAYYKCAAMHYSLRSILGDSLYFKALRQYASEWLFKHPYEDEFVVSFEKATGLELDAYLDQWFYSRKQCDYTFDGKSTRKTSTGYEHTIRLKQPGDMVAPVDVAVVWEQGDTTMYTIAPEGMAFAKPDAILMPTWHQFRRPDEKYSFTIASKRQISKIVVDPFCLLPDVNRLDNASGMFPPMEVRLDNMKYDRPPVHQLAVRVRPDVWYTRLDGLQLGFHSHGSYLERKNQFSLDARIGTKSGDPSLDITIRHPERLLGRKSDNFARLIMSDTRIFVETGTEVDNRAFISRPDRGTFGVALGAFITDGKQYSRELSLPQEMIEAERYGEWDLNDVTYARAYWSQTWSSYRGVLSMANTTMYGQQMEKNQMQGFFENISRIEGQLRCGPRTIASASLTAISGEGAPPTQFLQHLSSGQKAAAFTQSKLFRTRGTVPDHWLDECYPAYGIVRGYQDRWTYFTDAFAASLTLHPPDVFPYRWFASVPLVGTFLSQLDNTLFIDYATTSLEAGDNRYRFPYNLGGTSLNYDKADFVSAGISITMPPVWSNHRVRVDFPLYLNRPILGQREFEYRWSFAWLLPSD